MRYVDNGSGRIPLLSLVAILSISLTVNLPGLAVSPLLGKLQEVFPTASQIETQLLISLPNLIIIPFILIGGRLCTADNRMMVLLIGLTIYTLAGVMCVFAKSMAMLILLSCLLGIGCGLVIPLAASLIALNFSGPSRTKELGMKSGVSNFMVIFATLFVGWIAELRWNMAFLVYLVPVVPMCLIPFMTSKYIKAHTILDPKSPLQHPELNETPTPKTAVVTTKPVVPPHPNFHFQGRQGTILLLGVIGLYIGMTYATMVVSDYLPFTMKHYRLTPGDVGTATAIFFLAATVAGFTLSWCINRFGQRTPYYALGLICAGLVLCGLVHVYVTYIIGVFFIGYGYGIMQPIIYDKTAFIAPTAKQATQYFAYTLTGNYIAIAIVPFIVKLAAAIFHASTVNFPYLFNAGVVLLLLYWGWRKRNSYIFYVSRDMH